MKKAIHIFTIILISIFMILWFYLITRDTFGISMNEFFIYQKNPLPSSDKIVIVKVDNTSLDALQKTDIRVLNLTKTVFAHLIEKLNQKWARAIGIDIVFTNRSEDESVLVDTLKKYKNVVIWAKIGVGENTEKILPREAFSWAKWWIIDTARHGKLLSRLIPVGTLSGSQIEAMSIALYRKYLSDESPITKNTKTSYTINPLKNIPLNNGQILIPFSHNPEGYPSYSLMDVLDGNIPEGAFSGKIVLVWEYGTLIHDAFLSPIDPDRSMPGVEFHANMLDGILTGTFLEEKNTWYIAIVFIILSSIVLYSLPITIHIIYMLLMSIIIIWSCRYIFATSGNIYDLYLLILSLWVTFITTIIYRHFVINRERRFIEQAFGHYISPEVVAKISKNPEALKLGWEKREITVIFSDIAGFTTISEQLWTEKLFTLIGEYLSEMTDILTSHGGTLDKYIGDAVMGFFGAPICMDDGHIRACATALDMQERLDELSKKWESEGIPEFHTRIGLHTGETMVWNIGSKNRFNYTVMWDTVNLASRLEWVNKEYGTLICVSSMVYQYSHKKYDFRELDTIRVKWKHEWIKIYELLGLKGTKNKTHDTYEEWLSLYYEWHYHKTIKILENILDKDHPSKTIIRRCKDLIKNDIKLEDGIWTMQTK